jgi:glycosyltransferase involved in cell wall biosynthesis
MRVAYLLESTELSGGVKVVLMQAEALARRGHRVTVVSPQAAPGWFRLSQAHFERSAFTDSPALGSADVRVATFWKTAAAAVAGARGPVFHLCQGYEGQFSFYREAWPEIEAAYRLPTRKLAVSGTLAARLDALGFGPAIDVGQAFDAGGFAPGPARPPADPPVVLLVGPTAVDLKGIGIALDGLALWRARGGRFRLRRVSYFPCEEEERRRGLTDEYHHGLPPERMPFAYRACDLFVGPSRAEEGFGLPALEALACGVPAALSDTAGHREMARDAASYFRDGSAESLAEVLPTLFGEDARRRARDAGPAAARRFDAGRVAERLEAAFLGALGTAR